MKQYISECVKFLGVNFVRINPWVSGICPNSGLNEIIITEGCAELLYRVVRDLRTTLISQKRLGIKE
jgi:hypothetical protein